MNKPITMTQMKEFMALINESGLSVEEAVRQHNERVNKAMVQALEETIADHYNKVQVPVLEILKDR